MIGDLYLEFSPLNDKTTNHPIKKCTKDLKKHLSKKDTQIAKKHVNITSH